MTPDQLKALMAWVDARIAESETSDLYEVRAEHEARDALYSAFGFGSDNHGNPMEGTPPHPAPPGPFRKA